MLGDIFNQITASNTYIIIRSHKTFVRLKFAKKIVNEKFLDHSHAFKLKKMIGSNHSCKKMICFLNIVNTYETRYHLGNICSLITYLTPFHCHLISHMRTCISISISKVETRMFRLCYRIQLPTAGQSQGTLNGNFAAFAGNA